MDFDYKTLFVDRLVDLVIVVVLFLAAFIAQKVLFFILRKLLPRASLARRVIDSLSKPILFFFLEAAALFSLLSFGLSYGYEEVGKHVCLILVLATTGFAFFKVSKGVYEYFQEKYSTEDLEDFSKRAVITKTRVLYRTALIIIVIITLACILMTFPSIKSFGIGLLGSAGVVGLALGLAARPILLNLIAGFQIAFSEMLRLGDAVVVEGESGRIEEIFLTHVVVKTWDLRRLILPISYFIDKPYQNWTSASTELIGTIFLYCDYQVRVDAIREKFHAILASSGLWNQKTATVDVVDMTEQSLKIRLCMSSFNPSTTFNLQCQVREKLIGWLQSEYPDALPKLAYHDIRSTQ